MIRAAHIKEANNLRDSGSLPIAVIDSGCVSAYRAKLGELCTYTDFIGTEPKSVHGTIVLDIIRNFLPRGMFHIYRVLNDENEGNARDFLNALRKALLAGCRVLNISLGTREKQVAAPLREIAEHCKAEGIFFVCSMPEEESYPGYLPEAIRVSDDLTPLAPGSVVEPDFRVRTPFMALYSCSDFKGGEDSPSYAAAFVSGLLALLSVNYPDESREWIVEKAKEITRWSNAALEDLMRRY